MTGWRAVAWVLALVGWLLAGAAIAVAIAGGRLPDHVAYWVMDVVVALLYGLAVLLLVSRTRHPAGWILALTAWGCGAAALADVWILRSAEVTGWNLAYFARFWTWVPGLYLTVAVLPFLVVRPPAPWRQALVAAGTVAALLATLPGLTIDLGPSTPNPTALQHPGWQAFLRALGAWPDRAVTALGALAAGWIAVQLRRAGPDRRPGLQWLLAGQAALVMAMVVFLLPMGPAHAAAAAELSGALLLLAQAFLPAALLTLVLSRQLWGVDATVDRATLWTVMTAVVALGYLALVTAAGWALPVDSAVAAGLAVAAVGLAFHPVRAAIQRRVDRLVYGTGADPAVLWSHLGTASDQSLTDLAEALRRGLRLGSVRIVTADAPDDEAAPGDTVTPLVSRGRTVGSLVVRPRTGERLDRRTLGLLDQVATLVATALDLGRANAALDGARSRLVDIRDEERRALRRDLHDGLGPALAGIRLGITAAINLRDRDPEAADRMLVELGDELQRRGEDVRRLSRDLMPPALDDGDLATALNDLAARFGDDGLEVTVVADTRLDLPPNHQVALYHVAAEAVLNTRRHASATRCQIVVRRRSDGGTLLLVTDDGRGIDPAGHAGVGLRSMRERAADLAGTVEVSSPADGGTRVAIRLPAAGR